MWLCFTKPMFDCVNLIVIHERRVDNTIKTPIHNSNRINHLASRSVLIDRIAFATYVFPMDKTRRLTLSVVSDLELSVQGATLVDIFERVSILRRHTLSIDVSYRF